MKTIVVAALFVVFIIADAWCYIHAAANCADGVVVRDAASIPRCLRVR